MAKFLVWFKDPDGPYEAMREATNNIPAGDVQRVCDKFDIGEEICLELDTEAMTCVLHPDRYRQQSEDYYLNLNEEWKQEKAEKEEEIRRWEEAVSKAPTDGVAPSVRGYNDIEHPMFDDKAQWKSTTSDTGLFKGETVQRIPIRMRKGR